MWLPVSKLTLPWAAVISRLKICKYMDTIHWLQVGKDHCVVELS